MDRQVFSQTRLKDGSELLDSIRNVSEQLRFVWKWFDAETDPDLMDACIYRRLSLEAEYRYLIKAARHEGIHSDF